MMLPQILLAQQIQYTLPEEGLEHEGTWLQWPHNNLYGPYYQDDVEPTWIAMTNALQDGEKVHIIALNSAHQSHIVSALTLAGVPLTNVDFYLFETDDVWVRDNGPIFVYDENNLLTVLDWGFNGWGGDTPFSNCDLIPQSVAADLAFPLVDLSAMVLEGGAVEHDGQGTMIATRSSVTHSSRNPGLTETDIENYMTTYLGFTNFIWLDGLYGSEITDMHIDGFARFANDSTLVTMNSTDLTYWEVSPEDQDTLYAAKNISGIPYNLIFLPLTQNNIITTYGANLGYKGSYVNYYIANDVVLMPTYNDPNDNVAKTILETAHPDKTVIGIDVRNIYEYGGMIHCITQQQPVDLVGMNTWDYGLSSNLIEAYPNPATDQVVIKIAREEISDVKVELFDTQGRSVAILYENPAFQGEMEIEIDLTGYPSGIYIYSATFDQKWVKSNKVVIE